MSGEEAVMNPHLIVHYRASGMQLNSVENGVYTYQVNYYPVQYEFTHTIRLQNLLITDLRGMVSDYPHAQFRFLGPPEIWCPTETVFSGLDYNNDASTQSDPYCNVRGDDMVDNFAQSSKKCSHTECAENVHSRVNVPENDGAEAEDTRIKYSVNLPPETSCKTDLKTKLDPNNMNHFQRTVKILNVTEDPEEDTKSLVMKLILKSRRFLLKGKDILHCKRVGCQNKSLPRPIIVTFNSKHTCNKVLQRFSYDDLQIVKIDTESKAKREPEVQCDTGVGSQNVSVNNSESQLQESENALVNSTLSSLTDDSNTEVKTTEYISNETEVINEEELQPNTSTASCRKYLQYESRCFAKSSQNYNLECNVKCIDLKYEKKLLFDSGLNKDDKGEQNSPMECSSKSVEQFDGNMELNNRNKNSERIESTKESVKELENFGYGIDITGKNKAQSESTAKCDSRDYEDEFKNEQNMTPESKKNFVSDIESENKSKIHQNNGDRKFENNLLPEIGEHNVKHFESASSKKKYSKDLLPKSNDCKFQQTNTQYEDNLLSEVKQKQCCDLQPGHSNIKYVANLSPDLESNNNDTHQEENRSVECGNIFPSASNLGEDIELTLDKNGSCDANTLYDKSLRILQVKEDPGEDLKQLVIKLVLESRGVSLQSKDILLCKRIGKRRDHRPRAIVVTFTSRNICKKILKSPKSYDLTILQELSPEINSLRHQASALFGSENVRLRGRKEILVKLQDESTVTFESVNELHEFIANTSREYAVIVNSPEIPNRITGDFTL